MKDTENRPPSRKRRKWGSVIVRRDTDGNPISFQARYVNPLDPPKKVGRNFGLEYETEAYKWLDEEHYLVTLHNKGIRQWVHPSQRGAGTMPTFREYSKDYFDGYRKPVYFVKLRWTCPALNLNTVGVQLEHRRRLVPCFVVCLVYFMRECLFR